MSIGKNDQQDGAQEYRNFFKKNAGCLGKWRRHFLQTVFLPSNVEVSIDAIFG
jgi:hypothetical protein